MTREELVDVIRGLQVSWAAWGRNQLCLDVNNANYGIARMGERVGALSVSYKLNTISIFGSYDDIIAVVLAAQPELLDELRRDAHAWCASTRNATEPTHILLALDPLHMLLRSAK